MPPLVPAPSGFDTVGSVDQLDSVLKETPRGGVVKLYLPPGSMIRLSGAAIRVEKIEMHLASGGEGATIDAQFKALSDGTRRALLEYLVREGEQSVHALTAIAGVSQPMVSRHLGKLKRAKLVTARKAGRETFYSARAKGLAPVVQWMAVYGALWSQRFTALEDMGT